MKKKMIRTIAMGAMFVLVFSCASGPKAYGPSATAWDWMADGDAVNGGTSTLEMTDVTEKGVPTYKFTGAITNAWEYGNVYVKLYPDGNTLDIFKTASAFSFTFTGDGEQYIVEVATSDITDYCYFQYIFDTIEGAPKTVIVPMGFLIQPPWGEEKANFKQDAIEFIQFQTTRGGQPGPVEFTIGDVKLYSGGIPTEKQAGAVKAAKAPAAAAPKGIGGDMGAFSLRILDNFEYGDGYQGEYADKRLFNGHRIEPGETYTLKITYTASRDLEAIVEVGLVDRTPAAQYWRALSWDEDADIPMESLPASKAGETVSATLTFTTIKQSSGVSAIANSLVFITEGEGKKGVKGSGVQKPVTFDFTEFVFTEGAVE